MSASGGSTAIAPLNRSGLRPPWKKGESGNPTGLSPERRALLDAIEKNEVPKVLTMLAALYARGIDGDDFAAREWLLQVRGPVKPRTDEQLETAIETKLLELIAQARAQQTP